MKRQRFYLTYTPLTRTRVAVAACFLSLEVNIFCRLEPAEKRER